MTELAFTLVAVTVSFMACSLYYCRHLHLLLTECESDYVRGASAPASNLSTSDSLDRTKYIRDHGSRVWCHGRNNTDRRCIFIDICYHTQYNDFVFLHSSQSIHEGVPDDRQSQALVDLSSVADHNTQYFHYVDVPVTYLESVQNVTYLEGQYVLFNRFNAGNLMHVFHDDLLPVFHTLLNLGFVHIKPGHVRATLVMSDTKDEGEYLDLYRQFSKNPPILTPQLQFSAPPGLVCFEEMHVGLSKSTTWYQYGFQIPQGPIENATVSAKEIKLFTSYVTSKLGITDHQRSIQTDSNVFIILARRGNRLILNEVDVSMALVRHFNAHVIVASLETHSLVELIQLVSSAKGLVAVHGSLLVLSMFLPKHSVFIEIFPYAVNPDNYTPYRTLAHLQGMHITYKAWRNLSPHNTITFPDAQPEFGGISHLPSEEQERIKSSSEVPPHLCCSDPEWLFRIYQDTKVDIQSFVDLVAEAVMDSGQKAAEDKTDTRMTLAPGAVRNITCWYVPANLNRKDEIGIMMSWQPPWNIQSFQDNGVGDMDLQYEVLIQEQGQGELYAGAFVLASTSHTFVEDFKRDRVYYSWIRCTLGGKAGSYSAVTSCPYMEV